MTTKAGTARCVGHAQLFDSTDPTDHAEAARLCESCPFVDECRTRLEEARRVGRYGPPEGTWAGQLVLTRPRRRSLAAARRDRDEREREARRDRQREDEERRARAVVAVIEQTAQAFDITVEAIHLPNRSVRQVADARAVAYYLARRLTGETYPRIGQVLSRDHSTVMYGCRRVASTPRLLTIAEDIAARFGERQAS